eukprot:scaffold36208_cov78-Phaeocystis_antarctica.AAC.2
MPPARIRPLTSALRSVAQEGSCTSLQLALQLWPVHPVGLYCPVGVLKCCAVVSRHNASTPRRSISRIGSTAALAWDTSREMFVCASARCHSPSLTTTTSPADRTGSSALATIAVETSGPLALTWHMRPP